MGLALVFGMGGCKAEPQCSRDADCEPGFLCLDNDRYSGECVESPLGEADAAPDAAIDGGLDAGGDASVEF
ncbi:hypothetical protein [Haliangium ochraceum]|uniref:hypothetical protein n=1 Tax=Haliangium ochraceum TaxID=80816 RepID=UPI001269BF48|nr:hypothetical protein [Haliangium ochraceum]